MIISEIVKIKFTNNNTEIESLLKKIGITPIRWAIVDADNTALTVSVSYIKN